MNYIKENFPDLSGMNNSLSKSIAQNTFLEAIQEPVFILDIKGIIRYINYPCAATLGWPKEEIINYKDVSVIHHDSSRGSNGMETASGIFQVLNNGKTLRNASGIFWNKEGAPLKVAFKASAILDSGEIIGVLVCFEKLNDAKLKEYQLRDINHRYRNIMLQIQEEAKVWSDRLNLLSRSMKQTAYDWDLANNKLWLSEGITTQFGYAPDEFNAEDSMAQWEACIHPDDLVRTKESFNRTLAEGKHLWKAKYRLKNKAGDYRTVADRGYLIYKEDGGHARMIGCLKDITEEEGLAAKLKESEERLRLALSVSNTAIYDWNIITNDLQWDDRSKEMFGLKNREDLKFQDFRNRIYPEDVGIPLKALERALDPLQRGEVDVEYRIIRESDRAVRWIKTRGKALFNASGQPSRFMGTAIDITEEKEAELAIAQNEQRVKMLIDSVPVGVWILDRNGEVVYVNKYWETYTGIPREYTFDWQNMIHPDDLEYALNNFKEAAENKRSFTVEVRGRYRNGRSYRWFFNRGIPRITSDNTFLGYIGVSLDIQDLKDAEKALKESLERFKFLAEAMPQKIWTADKEGNITYLNRQWYDYTGSSMEDSADYGWTKYVHPDDVKKTQEAWARVIREAADTSVEVRFRRKDGVYRWHISRGSVQKDEEGNVLWWVGSSTDIHDYKTALESLNMVNKKLQRTNTDLDTFIYTASHDLKAPISNLEGLLTAFVQEDHLNKTQQSILEMILQSIARLKNTIGDLTDISKAQRVNQEDEQLINLRDLIHEVELDISGLIEKYNPEIYCHLDVAEIRYSKKNLRSIVYNVLSNALKYSSPFRRPRIIISAEPANDCILLKISDNGLGISQENIGKIFGMFKRAHQHVEGSGIGLYIIKRLIENAGGRIEVESKLDEGTTFCIYFKSNNG